MATIAPASEVVRLFEPPEPPASSRTNCPHEQAGLVSFHEPSAWPGGAVPAGGVSTKVGAL